MQRKPDSQLALMSATWVAKMKIREGKGKEAAELLADTLKGRIANPASEQVEFLIDELVKTLVPRKKPKDIDADAVLEEIGQHRQGEEAVGDLGDDIGGGQEIAVGHAHEILAGAAVGGIIGNQSGRGLEGAAIGALLGGLAGSSLGASNDQRFYGNNVGYYGRPAPVVYRRVGYGYCGPVGFGNPCYGGRSSFSSVSFGSGFGDGCGPRGFGGSPFMSGGYSRGFGNSCW